MPGYGWEPLANPASHPGIRRGRYLPVSGRRPQARCPAAPSQAASRTTASQEPPGWQGGLAVNRQGCVFVHIAATTFANVNLPTPVVDKPNYYSTASGPIPQHMEIR